MFEKNMKISYLLDIYGSLLDDHIFSVMKAYYDDDLSLAEVATDEGISRQGVRHLVKKGEEKLAFFESKLGLAKLYSELDNATSELTAVRDALLSDKEYESEAHRLSDIIAIISKGN